MTYLLTAIGLPPCGTSTVHIYTQIIHITTKLTALGGRLSGVRTQSDQNNCAVLCCAMRCDALRCDAMRFDYMTHDTLYDTRYMIYDIIRYDI